MSTGTGPVIDISGTVTNVSTASVRYAAVHSGARRGPRSRGPAEHLATPPAGERLFEAEQRRHLPERGLAWAARHVHRPRHSPGALTEDILLAPRRRLCARRPGTDTPASRRVVGATRSGRRHHRPVSPALRLLTAPPAGCRAARSERRPADDLDDRLDTLPASARPRRLRRHRPPCTRVAGRLAEHVVDGETTAGGCGTPARWLDRLPRSAALRPYLATPTAGRSQRRLDDVLAGPRSPSSTPS